MKHEYYNMKHVRNVINGKKKIAGKAVRTGRKR